MRHNVDLFLQQQLEQKNLSSYSQNQMMDQQSRLSIGSAGGMMPPLPQQRLSFPDPYSSIDLLQHGGQAAQARRPFQRLSAPTTQADFSDIAVSIRNKTMEQEQAMSSAEQLLREVGGCTAPRNNPVEDLKQKLLNAVHSLEQAQASQQQQQMEQHPYPTARMYGNTRGQNIGLSSMNQYQSLLPPQNNFMMQQQQQQNNYLSQHQQRQHNLFGQAPPTRHDQGHISETSSISALMTALDQTRQVAAAAQAQSSLLQQVANDLALGRQYDK